jgi:hypothetical protein
MPPNLQQERIPLLHPPSRPPTKVAFPVADLGFSGGGDGLGDEGEGAGGGYPLPPGVGGLGPRENFLQIDVENMHFRGHV